MPYLGCCRTAGNPTAVCAPYSRYSDSPLYRPKSRRHSIDDLPAVLLLLRTEAKERKLLTELLARHDIRGAEAVPAREAAVPVLSQRPALILILVELEARVRLRAPQPFPQRARREP